MLIRTGAFGEFSLDGVAVVMWWSSCVTTATGSYSNFLCLWNHQAQNDETSHTYPTSKLPLRLWNSCQLASWVRYFPFLKSHQFWPTTTKLDRPTKMSLAATFCSDPVIVVCGYIILCNLYFLNLQLFYTKLYISYIVYINVWVYDVYVYVLCSALAITHDYHSCQ